MLDRSNLYQFFLLFSKRLCCLDLSAALPPFTRLFQELRNVYFVFSCFQVFWDKTGLSNEYVSLFPRGVFPTIKNVYEETKVIVKIEDYFSLFFNQITEILSRHTPQMFCCSYHRQIGEQINYHQQNVLHL